MLTHLTPNRSQFLGDEEVLFRRRGRFRLVHGDFEVEGAGIHPRDVVLVHHRGVGDGAPVLGGGAFERFGVEGESEITGSECLVEVARAHRFRRVLERVPRQRGELGGHGIGGGGVGVVIDVVAGIDGEEGVARVDEGVGSFGGLEVVGVRAPRRAPAHAEDAPHRVVHHLLRRAAGARVLAHRLLREDRGDVGVAFRGEDVARRGDAQPVAVARRRLQRQR